MIIYGPGWPSACEWMVPPLSFDDVMSPEEFRLAAYWSRHLIVDRVYRT